MRGDQFIYQSLKEAISTNTAAASRRTRRKNDKLSVESTTNQNVSAFKSQGENPLSDNQHEEPLIVDEDRRRDIDTQPPIITDTPTAVVQAYYASPLGSNNNNHYLHYGTTELRGQNRPVSATLNQIRYWKQIQTATENFSRLSRVQSSHKGSRR